MRIGHGYDVHKLVENRKLILGGVDIPYEKGLLGHSDADIVLHAICDALLGAAGLGDIGKHFPDNDNSFKDIDSRILLRSVAKKISDEGYKLSNLDVTIIAQAPKLAKYIPLMREKIAQDVCLEQNRVNVKATTEEGLGFTGEKLGISAHAVCLLEE